MRTVGLIGGMSWESTLLYYRIINQQVGAALGKLHSAPLLIYSFDFEVIAELQRSGQWNRAATLMAEAGSALKAAGAQALVICTNTMHIAADAVEAATGLPVLHIADGTGEAISQRGIRTVGLLGTQFTMEKPFYRQRLKERFNIDVLIPDELERAEVHRVIYEELCKGIINPASKAAYHSVISALKARGAEAIILGCTEICLLLEGNDYNGLPLFNTTLIHAQQAASFALTDSPVLEPV